MLVVWVILLVLFLLLAFLLLNPFQLYLNSFSGDYRLRWRGLASARLTGEADDPVVRLWLLGWRREWHLLQLKSGKKKQKEQQEKPADQKKGIPEWMTSRLAVRLLKTFRIRTFHLLLDTDNYVTNAYLYPIFHQISNGKRQLAINFSGRNELELFVTNRIWNIAWVFITGIIQSKF